MHVLELPSRRGGKIAAIRDAERSPDAPLSPATYIRLRRLAHGRTREEIVRRMAKTRGTGPLSARLEDAGALLAQLETPGVRARRRDTIDLLSLLVGFDPAVYWQLADEPADRHPRVCRACGCSGYDPCTGHAGVCTLEHGLCSRCEDALAREAA